MYAGAGRTGVLGLGAREKVSFLHLLHLLFMFMLIY